MEVKEAFNVRLLFICQVLIRLYAVFLFSVCKRVWSILYFLIIECSISSTKIAIFL